jgi:hypothetical protein
MKYIKLSNEMKITVPKNIQVFHRTILQYCSENQSIRLTGPPPYFTDKIFRMIKANEITQGVKLTEKHHRLCYASLSNLSLVATTHTKIWTPEHLKLLFKNIREMKVLFQEGSDYLKTNRIIALLKKNYLKYIYSVRTFTNCLMSEEHHKSFESEDIGPIFNEWVQFLTFFSEWKTHKGIGALSTTLIDEIDKCDELSFFIQTLVEECTLGLLLIFNDDEET